MGSYSKRTNPFPSRPAQAEAVEHQPFASHYRRTHGHQGRLDLVPAELREGDRNHRTKRLLRQLASWDRRIASDEVERKPVVDSLVEGSPVEGREIPAVAEESRLAGGKESLAVGGKAFLAVKHTVMEGSVRLVVGGRVNPVVAEDKAIVANSQADEPHIQIRPGVVETAWDY